MSAFPEGTLLAPGSEPTTEDLPGRVVLVVGPSGSGKDTLIEATRVEFAGNDRFVFPRRIVTRPPSQAEDNVEADERAFLDVRARGGFSLSWSAHGHWYGIPATIEADLARGATVVINVSRTVVAEARRRWPDVTVVEIVAPREVLASRIAARGRPTDGAGDTRLARRIEPSEAPLADRTIDNASDLATAVAAFLDAVVAA